MPFGLTLGNVVKRHLVRDKGQRLRRGLGDQDRRVLLDLAGLENVAEAVRFGSLIRGKLPARLVTKPADVEVGTIGTGTRLRDDG